MEKWSMWNKPYVEFEMYDGVTIYSKSEMVNILK